jgi:hypothetical protein
MLDYDYKSQLNYTCLVDDLKIFDHTRTLVHPRYDKNTSRMISKTSTLN